MLNNSSGYCDDAFRAIFNNYKNRLYGYVLAISHSHYAAEEITQEVFIKLWICRDILDRVDDPDGYIFTMARNKTLNHLRKAGNNAKLLTELKNAMTTESNTEQNILLHEYEKFLHEAIALLSPQRRLVYQLSREQNMNHKEIAKHLNLSRNTVKNHIAESLRIIRNHLGKYISTTLLLLIFITC
ncbi:MAG TPA: RNA polymerase sigma-70 factor [Chitinophagaceae bacterium]|jgi:RNA polymerase sigma-70 factor (ECF subfamily)